MHSKQMRKFSQSLMVAVEFKPRMDFSAADGAANLEAVVSVIALPTHLPSQYAHTT